MGECRFRVLRDEDRTPGTKICKDGVHFGYYAAAQEPPSLLLYKKGSEEIAARIVFPKPEVPGNFYSMKVSMDTDVYEYNFLDAGQVVTDPYARGIAGRNEYGKTPSFTPHGLRGVLVSDEYDWKEDALPEIPFCDVIMYHLHVRGFTMHKNSGVSQKGTFAGLARKIPYLKSLGVNQVKLMPVYEFSELEIPDYYFERTITPEVSVHTNEDEKTPAEKNADAAGGTASMDLSDRGAGTDAGTSANISVETDTPAEASRNEVLEHAFDRPCSERMEQTFRKNYWGYGPGFYFAPKASYAASGCAQTEFKDLVRAFHKNGIEVILEFAFSEQTDIAQICDCLKYWADTYHVDGFSIVGRDGLSRELARLPLFGSRKLICGWYPDGTAEENAKKGHHRIAQSNDGFMNDARRLLKGDAGSLEGFGWRIRQNPSGCAQINYITNHDGFTLLDLVSYNMKYNDANGEMGRDGSDQNFSRNCGEEGPSGKRKIAQLRMRQRKNAFAMMLLSQGTPMLLAGDEFGNTQQGNNNPWCHDSELTWLDWSHTKANRELTGFVRQLIAFRKAHRVLHLDAQPQCVDYLSSGFPDLSYHSERAWYGDLRHSNLHMGCMYSGYYAREEGFLYLAWNFHWEEQQLALPLLPAECGWYRVMDTSLPESFLSEAEQEILDDCRVFTAPPRSVVILEGRKRA